MRSIFPSLTFSLGLLASLGLPSLSGADPTSVSICDDPNQPHNAIWEKYCGGGNNAQSPGLSPEQIEQNRLVGEARYFDQQGMEAYQNKAYDTAAAYFEQALERTPDDPEIQQNLRNAKAKIEAQDKFKGEKNDALNDLKDTAGDTDDGLKGSSSNEDGLKDTAGNDDALKDAPSDAPKPKKKKKVAIIHLVNKNCPCGGLDCHCLHPNLCGGVRKCDCHGVDCTCPKSVCKFAGTFNPCDGTVADNDPALGKVQRCRATCGCGYPQGGCMCSVDCKCSKKK